MYYDETVNGWPDADEFCITQAMLEAGRRLEMKHLMPDRSPDSTWGLLANGINFPPKIREQADQMKRDIGRGFIIDFNELFPIGSKFCHEMGGWAELRLPVSCTILKKMLHFPHTKDFSDMRKFGFLLCTKELLKIYMDLTGKKTIAICKWDFELNEPILIREYAKFVINNHLNYPSRTILYRRVKGIQRDVFAAARDEYNRNMRDKVKVVRSKDKNKRVRKAELFTLSDGTQTTVKDYMSSVNISRAQAYRVLRKLTKGGE